MSKLPNKLSGAWLLISVIALLVFAANALSTPSETAPQPQVSLLGEFHNPGVYTLSPGETLFQLMLRAGGLTAQAYPYGAVLTREHLRRQARQQHTGLLHDLQTALHHLQSKNQPAAKTYIQHLMQKYQTMRIIGRAVIEADPAILQVRSEQDTVLQDGDTIYMPRRMNTIQVFGEVLNQGSFPFVSGKNADYYIKQAGGMTADADHDRLFAILPNGVTQPLEISYWNYTPVKLPPNSAILVSRVESPFDHLMPMHNMQHWQAQWVASSMLGLMR